MKQYTVEFDYNVPAEFTATRRPDRVLNVKAVGRFYDDRLTTWDLTYTVSDMAFMDCWDRISIYRQCEIIAKKRLQSSHNDVVMISAVELAEQVA